MSAILTATATFTPKDPKRFVDLVVLVRLFAKVRKAQAIVAGHAREFAPIGTGELQASIQEREPVDDLHRIVGEVVATAGHASFIEFGTGLLGAGTYPGDLPKAGVPITGAWIYDYKKQNWRGMPAQPYMRPALDMARLEVLEEFRG